MKTTATWKSCILIGLALAGIICLAYLLGMFSTVQLRAQDSLYGGNAPLKNIIILAIDDKSIQAIGRWPWDRAVFANLLSKLSDARLVAFDVVFSEPSSSDSAFAQAIKNNGKVILSSEYAFTSLTEAISHGTIKPLPEFRDAALDIGAVNLITDNDGVTRAVNTNVNGEYPLLAETIATHIIKTPVPKTDRLLINMIGPKGTFTTIPLVDILNGTIDSAKLSNAIILIGATAPDLHDDQQTPTSEGLAVPGVEIQANLLQTILTKNYLHEENKLLVILLALIFALLVALLLLRLHAWMVAVICACALLAYYFIVAALFSRGILADMIILPLCVLSSYVGNIIHLFIAERKQKREVVEAFSKYVAPEIVKELFKHPDKLKLGGEKRPITIFFSDVRGFTTISEKLTPELLVHLLNDYLSAMTDIIMASGGIVDKYIGDAIMAFWGAPLDQPDHAMRASEASLTMVEKLAQLREKWKKEGFPSIDIGIGMNTGDAVIGNMGSHQRFNYTCMGDNINLGSRLEGLTKEYAVQIIISESTRKLLPKVYIVRELDSVRVKGKYEPITIYELVGKQGHTLEKKISVIALFENALAKYRAQQFEAAKKLFEKAAALGDETSNIFSRRCDHFLKEKPPKDWDGVWVMKTK